MQEITSKKHQTEINIDKAWKRVENHINKKISQRTKQIWFKNFYLKNIVNNTAYFICENDFKREWIETNHRLLIKNALKDALGQPIDFVIGVEQKKKPLTKKRFHKYEYYDPNRQSENLTIFNTKLTKQQKLLEKQMESQLNAQYTLENFVVGSSNNIAFAIAQAVLEKPGQIYNPVFIWGNTGVGKTHLMQAIGNAYLKHNINKNVYYCSAEDFLQDVIEAIRTNSTPQFKKRYQSLDMLIIDDIQFITKSPKTQEELFHVFNNLYQSNKQIIMASDRPPAEINKLTERLRSRFEGGMVVDIQPPDYETKMAILKQKVLQENINIPMQYLDFIASNIDSNIRQLEGAITKIQIHLKYSQREMTEEDLSKILGIDITSKRRKVSPEKIIQIVADVFEINKTDIKGSKRTARVSLARQTAMYLMREELQYPLKQIAREVNRKDHTTVIHACEKIEEKVVEDTSLQAKVQECKSKIAALI